MLSNLAILTLTEALKRQTSTVVTVIGTSEIVLSYMAQVLIMGDESDVYSIVGASVVLLGIIAITLEPGQHKGYSAPGENNNHDEERKPQTGSDGEDIEEKAP